VKPLLSVKIRKKPPKIRFKCQRPKPSVRRRSIKSRKSKFEVLHWKNFDKPGIQNKYHSTCVVLSGGQVGAINLLGDRGELLAFGMAVAGGKPRKQDSIIAQREDGLVYLGVSDGVGGREKGDRASNLGVLGVMTERDWDLPGVIDLTNQRLLRFLADPEPYKTPAATLALASVEPATGRVKAAAVGDSLIYVVSQDGEVLLLNFPHKMIFDPICPYLDCARNLEKEIGGPPYDAAAIIKILRAIKRSDNGHILSAMLGDRILPRIPEVGVWLSEGDSLVVVSDGMTLMPEQIRFIFEEGQSLRENTKELILQSLKKNGYRGDNVAAVVYTQGKLSKLGSEVFDEPA
jgi:serine/threonine protein phosphatase PrpC